jgi:hypothetical protein
MSAVYKHSVRVNGPDHTIPMLEGAQIVHVACQSDPYWVELWAVVDQNAPTEDRTFIVVGTGHSWSEPWQYVGTAIAAEGALVWHLLELGAERHLVDR